MALLQWKSSLDSPWLDNLTPGKPFLLTLGIGAMYRRRIRSSEVYFLYGRLEL
jgi:hypothetical protein